MKILGALLLAVLAASPIAGAATPDLPDRIARLEYVEGRLSFQAPGQPAGMTLPNRPLLPDDRLVTQADARAEIALGTATLRLDERTAIDLETLDADCVRVRIDEGIAVVTLRELADGETFEVATPNTTLKLLMPGEYRVEVPTEGVSALTVHGGAADAETAGGPVHIADGQRVRFEGHDALAMLETARPADAFDEWVLEREVKLAEAEPSEYTEEPPLDNYGEWQDDPTYGRVWMPSYAYSGYDPFGYGYGSWQYVGFGWSWIDPYPWSSYTSYGGRWVYLHHAHRWCWQPPRHDTRPLRWRTIPDNHQLHAGGRADLPVVRPRPTVIAREPAASPPRVTPREPVPVTPRTTPIHPRGGTFVPTIPRDPNPPRPATTPSRPSRDSDSNSASTPAVRRAAATSNATIAPPSREHGAIAPP